MNSEFEAMNDRERDEFFNAMNDADFDAWWDAEQERVMAECENDMSAVQAFFDRRQAAEERRFA